VTAAAGRSRGSGRPTLDQVATRAGVGRGTVSRVVNGSTEVSPATRAAVEAAIGELGYVPNRAARSLVTRRTDSVALIVCESPDRLLTEPFFAGLVRGASGALADTGIQLWLDVTQSGPHRERLAGYVGAHQVDGVLLVSQHGDDPLAVRLAEAGVPTVTVSRPVRPDGSRPAATFVDVDNVSGARDAVAYLASTGRRRIATIAGPQDMSVGVDRLDGYRAALRAAGLPRRADLVAVGDFGEDSGAAAMATILHAHRDVDAVFAASDLMAAGALRVLRERGRRVPEDVAVVGFDDSPLATRTDPALTTVHQPVVALGREMALLLLRRIRGEVPAGTSVLLDTHLVRRDSA